ncbi:MAG: HD domain-containing protein [Gemmatimonadetes bacterium]|nr:HD domain-containing protein [Gemmatimonadota bacterium]NIY08566.1 HD domain-containing protein [Gemmatimonadota bacterium]
MGAPPPDGPGRDTGVPGAVVRDPLWGPIGLDGTARRVVDSAAFQRLRYIRQLGLAHLVYPGASHTRFDHALGVYHLIRRAIAGLAARGGLDAVDPVERRLVPLAGLLHDVGHYPFSHALEELDEPLIPGHHEALTGRFLRDPDVRAAIESVASDGVARVESLIRGRSASPLQGLVSGSLDLDKVEYLKRDARFCGVPYGEVDVDRLLNGLMVLTPPEGGRPEVGVHEKGVAALESLLFAKYQMFRNVYWHHAVRAGTVLYKRIVFDALAAGLIEADELVGKTDEALLFLLAERAGSGAGGERKEAARRVAAMVEALHRRELPKRAAEVVAAELDAEPAPWTGSDGALKRAVEDRLADELDLPAGAVFLDYPEKPGMFRLDLLVQRRTGEMLRLEPGGRAGLIGLPGVADELYRTARVLRLFTLGGRRMVDAGAVARLVALPDAEIRARLDAGTPLLG